MTPKIAQFVNKGMVKDFSISKMSNEFAFDNKNIRITTRGDNSFLSVTNEKSNKKIEFSESIQGIIIGYAVINNYLVLFSKGDLDRIYKCEITDTTNKLTLLYEGNLKFDVEHPIETLTSYESKDIQKVYWVDGINQPRVINIEGDIKDNNDYQFDFVPVIDSSINVDVIKEYNGTGYFTPGVIQYVVTYYNKFGQESNPVYVSPLYYLSFKDRGGKADETITCSFKITLSNLDVNYDYVRVYSLQRTSENSAVVGHIVSDLVIKNNGEVTCIDTGTRQDIIDANSLILSNASIFFPSTIAAKDNTLFLGNLVTDTDTNKEAFGRIKEYFESIRNTDGTIKTSYSDLLKFELTDRFKQSADNTDYYEYENQLSNSSAQIKTFKFDERYRIGIQFQNSVGQWSSTLWIADIDNPLKPEIVESETDEAVYIYKYPSVVFTPSDDLKEILDESDYVNYRISMVEPTLADRKVVSQGFVTPTVYNALERKTGVCWGEPSWVPRMINVDRHRQNVNKYIKGKTEDKTLLLSNEIDGLFEENRSLEYNYLDTTFETYFEDAAITAVATTVSITFYPSVLSGVVLYKGIGFDITIAFDIFEDANDTPTYTDILFKVPIFNMGDTYLNWKNARAALINELVVPFSNFKTAYNGDSSWEAFKAEVISTIEAIYGEGVAINILGVDESTILWEKDLVPSTDTFKKYAKKSFVQSRRITDFRDSDEIISSTIDTFKNDYYTDASLVSFYAPNMEELYPYNDADLKLRIVGAAKLGSTMSDYRIEFEDKLNAEVFKFNFNALNPTKNLGLKTHFLFHSSGSSDTSATTLDAAHAVSMWGKNGSLNNIEGKNTLKYKTFGNLWYFNTDYNVFSGDYTDLEIPDISAIKVSKEGSSLINVDDKNYNVDYDNLLTVLNTESTFEYQRLDDIYLGANRSKIEEEISNFKTESSPFNATVSIKYKQSPHAVFSLLPVANKEQILPQYSSNSAEVNKTDVSTGILIGGKTPTELLNIWGVENLNSFEDIQRGKVLTIKAVPTSVLQSKTIGNIVVICGIDANKSGIGASIINKYIPYFVPTDQQSSGINGRGLMNIMASDAESDSGFSNKKSIPGVHYAVCKVIGANTENVSFNDNIGTVEVEVLDSTKSSFQGVISLDSPLKDLKDIVDTTEYDYIKKLPITFAERNLTTVSTSNTVIAIPLNSYQYDETYNGTTYDTSKLLTLDTPSLWIAELYRDLENPYGGTSENAIENNVFIPIGNITKVTESSISTEGDTYFQRWDCLRTYPESENQEINGVVDVVSLMLETHTNLDGRSDVNRGRYDVINNRPNNINVYNSSYNQSNNIFSSRVLDSKFDLKDYPNSYTWSLSKVNTADIDNWTKGLMINVESLDGTRGPLNKLKLWNDYLIAFQDEGIARINYNNQAIFNTSQGMPVEIVNSGKVSGHTYMATNTGCVNKWTIVESPAGLYYVDSVNKTINLFGGQINSISNNKGFRDWTKENIVDTVWNPNNNGFYGSYDKVNQDYYLTNKDWCLCFSEQLQQFSSFYDYTKSPVMLSLNSKFVGVENSNTPSLWLQQEGDDYCNFYGEYKPFHVEYKVNPEPISDKTFTNIEYRADVFDAKNTLSDTFNKLEAYNEYQSGIVNIDKVRFTYPNSERKFRIWRLDIPRDSNYKHGLDRIRNPWVNIKLTKTQNTNNKMVMHDLLVKYFE